MRFDGMNFRHAPSVVILDGRNNIDGVKGEGLSDGFHYLRFGRLCSKDTKGAEATRFTHCVTNEVLYAKPVKVKGYSLTNMAYGADGRVYLAFDGWCYTCFVKSASERANEKLTRRLERQAKAQAESVAP